MSRCYDVAIVGCGPVGALAGNLLAARGIKTLIIERELEPHPEPRAVHLDHEMMRLFQDIRLIDALKPLMRETQGHLHVGADHGVIRYMGTAGREKPFGWANDYFFWQPELESVLRDGLDRFADAELLLGAELTGCHDHADTVVLDVVTEGGSEQVTARWLIACDGARSFVRKALGIQLEDLHFEEPWLVVDVEADGPVAFPDLWGVPDEADLQQLSVMMCDPKRPATIVPGRGRHRRWEFMLLPGENEAEMMQPERVAALLAPYLAGVPHRIARAATYRFHGLIAERWRSGRVLLAGDAAHQTPPFFGQGMCHGMRDVANLAWKLARVIRREADHRLLDTYQEERDPHVRAVVSAAIEAGRYICELDPERASARDADMRARAVSTRAGTAADLIPRIVAGAVLPSPGAGERFIQPRLADGRLLDDAIGGGWRAFVSGGDVAAVPSRLDAKVVDVQELNDGGAIRQWLDARGVSAVLVRPDFYAFGTGDEVARLLASAEAAVGVVPAILFAGEPS